MIQFSRMTSLIFCIDRQPKNSHYLFNLKFQACNQEYAISTLSPASCDNTYYISSFCSAGKCRVSFLRKFVHVIRCCMLPWNFSYLNFKKPKLMDFKLLNYHNILYYIVCRNFMKRVLIILMTRHFFIDSWGDLNLFSLNLSVAALPYNLYTTMSFLSWRKRIL